jgi:hypothetical protein
MTLDQPIKTQKHDHIILSIPQHHVAKRILVYAPPRCFNADNSGAGFPRSAEKDANK